MLGGKYSSGTTAAAAGLEDLSPAPRVALMGRAARSAGLASGAPPAMGRVCVLDVASSAAFFLSVWGVVALVIYLHISIKKTQSQSQFNNQANHS